MDAVVQEEPPALSPSPRDVVDAVVQVGPPPPSSSPSNFVDAVVQVGPPSLNPSQDARKLQMTQMAQKDMDIMGLSPLAVIMMTVFGKVFPQEILEYFEHVRKKNISDSLVFGVFGSVARKATADNTAEPGRSHLSAQQVWI